MYEGRVGLRKVVTDDFGVIRVWCRLVVGILNRRDDGDYDLDHSPVQRPQIP